MRSSTAPGSHHGAWSRKRPCSSSPVLVEVAVEALQAGVDDLVVAALAGERAEGPAGHRDDRGRLDPLAQQPLQHVVDGVVLEEVDHLDGAGEQRGRPACRRWRARPSTLATRRPTPAARTRSATASGVRKLSWMNSPRVSPNCALRSVMIAVWGMGSPSGWRNSATTANQSASPPTIEASAAAWT